MIHFIQGIFLHTFTERNSIKENYKLKKGEEIIGSTKFFLDFRIFLKILVLKIRSLRKNRFSMILRLEIILPVMSYERKNIIFYEKNLKLTKNKTFNNVLFIRIFLTIASYQFFENYRSFTNHGLSSREKNPLQIYSFQF